MADIADIWVVYTGDDSLDEQGPILVSDEVLENLPKGYSILRDLRGLPPPLSPKGYGVLPEGHSPKKEAEI